MKRIWLIIVTIIVLGAVIAYWLLLSPQAHLQYLNKSIGITLTNNEKDVDVYDNKEFYIVAHIRLSDLTRKRFLEDKSLNPLDSSDMNQITAINEVKQYINILKPQNRALPSSKTIYLAHGRNDSQRWDLVLDNNTSRLWIVLFYPDPSGDRP